MKPYEFSASCMAPSGGRKRCRSAQRRNEIRKGIELPPFAANLQIDISFPGRELL